MVIGDKEHKLIENSRRKCRVGGGEEKGFLREEQRTDGGQYDRYRSG